MAKSIILKGIRTNNLQNIDLEIPLNTITALVGVSGAGKSSLAFHTLYAEGYIRYIESISPYIRQFLERVEKPDIDAIDNLPPAIAFRQKKPVKNPRSIVATAADIFDFLRILYAKIADFHCPGCGRLIRKYTVDEIIAELLALEPGNLSVAFEFQGDIVFLINRGYTHHLGSRGRRQKVDRRHQNRKIWVLLDELENSPANKGRLFEAIDSSIAMGKNTVAVFYRGRPLLFPVNLYCPHCQRVYENPDENIFSFNSARGACESCKGFGDLMTIAPDLVLDSEKSLAEGALRPLNTEGNSEYRDLLLRHARRRGIDLNKPSGKLEKSAIHYLLYGDGRFKGLQGLFDFLKARTYKIQARVFLSRYTAYVPCPACGGSRFNPTVLAFRIAGKNIADFLNMTIGQAAEFIATLDRSGTRTKISADVFTEIEAKLKYLIDSRLHYIQLNRPTFTLSRGESQRINLAFIMGSTLSDSLLIIDQPSADLHPDEYRQMESFLKNLKKNGNTIILIEHNRELVKLADWVIELGPLSGSGGGRVIFSGRRSEFFRGHTTVTQRHFQSRPQLKDKAGQFEFITLGPAMAHNLKGFNFRIPRQALTVIVGLSGAGKSSLLYDEMFLKKQVSRHFSETIYIDPGVGRLRVNTNVAGFLEVYAPIREFFAALAQSRQLGYQPGHFSFNSPLGRCPECKGKGYNEIEMQFLPAVRIGCQTCHNTGLQPDALKIRFQGRNIVDLFAMSIDDFLRFAADSIPQAQAQLKNLPETELGYLRLGQRLNSLAAGELQKLKLVKFLQEKKNGAMFLIDEPSFGLHPRDIAIMSRLMDRILANANTIVAVEHNLQVMAEADYMIELGPEGGENGGHLMTQGTPAAILGKGDSLTAAYLKKIVKNP